MKMSETESFPQYLRIALDIATRIIAGDMREGQKFSGRSLLASEYGVSPETIRRALKLLADMKVVDIKDKHGVYILSADNARRYVKNFEGWNEQQELKQRLKKLLFTQNELNGQIMDVFSEILKVLEPVSPTMKSLPNYSVRVSPTSKLIGKNIGFLQFWHVTGATIVAIRRAQNLIISPGPYAEIYGGDLLIFVGDPSVASTVEKFVNGSPSEDSEHKDAENGGVTS